MSYPVYYVIAGDTLVHLFGSYDGGTGASITLTGLAATDIEIYKDGSVTQRSSDAGYTLLDTDGIDFDGITGIHGFSIDLNDNTDAGFYTAGPWYHVVISAVTVDAQTVNFVACAFRILEATRGMAGTALPAAAADAAGGLPISDAGGLDMDSIKTDTAAILVDTGTTLQGEVDGIQADTEDIQARLPAALTGGRMDSSVGAMAAGTITASALADDAVDEILDDTVGDGTITVRQALRILIAGMAGKLSGAATTTVTIRNLADTADVVVATVDADGNRSAVTVTP